MDDLGPVSLLSDADEPTVESIGEFAARCLRANGVDTVFGIPGTHNIEIYRGLRRHGIHHALTRHEQGAAYAADGYARASGRAGVVIATSGPGATNCITGIANAYADSVPLLVLSPGAARGEERRDLGFLHEAKDQRLGMDSFSGASIRVESKEALEQAIHGTFLAWRTSRARPIHIEIPIDLIGERIETTQTIPWAGEGAEPTGDSIAAVAERMATARRPLIVAGGGCVAHSAALTALVELTGIPVVTTVQGKGAVPENHPLTAGALAGGASGFVPLGQADLVIALGTELKVANLSRDVVVARFDIDPTQLHKHFRSDLPVLGDLGKALAGLLAHRAVQQVEPKPHWQRQVAAGAAQMRRGAEEEWSVLHRAVITGADATLSHPVILTGDSSQISWLGTVRTAVLDGPRQFLTTDGYATLGYGLPAAIGAKVARPTARVISLLGDGALMFSVQELATASELCLSIPVVVFDNGGYAEIRQNMSDAGIDPLGVDLARPCYEALAKAFHCSSSAPTTPNELVEAVRAAFLVEHPTLIVVRERNFASDEWRMRGSLESNGEEE